MAEAYQTLDDTATPHNPCATCGACCRSYLVPVYGYDVWLISRRERLSPEQFLVACSQPTPGLDGFRLEGEGTTYGLALDKKGRFHPKTPCVFLMPLAGGHSRCGIYAHRPIVCQTYPMSMWSGVVSQRDDTLCPPGSWPRSEVMRPAWRHALQRLRLHTDVYHEVVARWNARIAAARPGRCFSLLEYYSYLMNVYDDLAAVDAEAGDLMDEVYAGWPNLPRTDAAFAVAPGATSPPLWLAYLSRVRQIVDRYYPEVAPPPVATGPVGGG